MAGVDPQRQSAAGALVGRDKELALLRSFAGRAAVEGAALQLTGEPGVGKTALLDAAADEASAAGARILGAGGAEFEQDLGFSGLSQLLLPLYGESRGLSAAHRRALSAALGFGGVPSDRLVVFTAALQLLRQAAEAQPLLVIIDDVQWLDQPSAAVLGFVARRLTGSRIGLLAASRTTSESFFELGKPSVREVRPLEDDAARRLVDARFPALPHGVRQRVVREAQGSPLALLELPAVLGDLRLTSARMLPAVLPLGQRLQRLYAPRISELPAPTRRLLLRLALDGTGDPAVLTAAHGANEPEDLLPAERAELVDFDDATRRFAFRHPLVRSTVVELSESSERRAAHRLLAKALTGQPERAAWHLAEATASCDEHVAALLEQAAGHAQRRGDAVGAVAALLRSADLSPGGPGRSRRLAQAACIGADVTGQLSGVPRLLADARNAGPQPGGSLQAAVAAALLLINEQGDLDTAHRLLAGAIETFAGSYEASDDTLVEALYALMTVCFFAGRPELWEPFDAALGRLTPRPPAVLSLCATFFGDPARATPEAIGELETIVSRLHEEADPAQIVRIGRASLLADRMTGCRAAHWRVVRDGREGGAITSAIRALCNLCVDDYLTGEWEEAQQLAGEGLQLCEAHGYHLLAWPLWFGQAIVAAARGDDELTSVLADKMDSWAKPRRARTVSLYAEYARALAALGRGDFEDAYHKLAAVVPPGRLEPHAPLVVWTPLDLAEAAVCTGRRAEALAHSNALSQTSLPSLSPRLAMISLAAAAIATPDDGPPLFQQALAVPGAERWPFDLARVQFAYGERLRRARAATEARTHLGAALEAFQRLGAEPWASRTASELRATGLNPILGTDLQPDLLTPQEREIAQLAAAGLTNKEIGEKLFLSHRTVANHLHRIFPKLGITSRAALRDALDARPRDHSAPLAFRRRT